MAQKRGEKDPTTAVNHENENDRFLTSVFQIAANDVSRFYGDCANHQKSAFAAGQRHSLMKLQEWMMSILQEGKRLTVSEIVAYLQGKLKEEGNQEEEPASGRAFQGVRSSSVAATTWSQENHQDDVHMRDS